MRADKHDVVASIDKAAADEVRAAAMPKALPRDGVDYFSHKILFDLPFEVVQGFLEYLGGDGGGDGSTGIAFLQFDVGLYN